MWLITVIIILYKILHDFVFSFFIKAKNDDIFIPPKYARLAYAQTFMIYILNEFTKRKYIPLYMTNNKQGRI